MSKFTKPSQKIIPRSEKTKALPPQQPKNPPTKFPETKVSAIKPGKGKDVGTFPLKVAKNSEEQMNRTGFDHAKAGTDNVLNAKKNLLWQRDRGNGPIKTIANNVKFLVSPPPEKAQKTSQVVKEKVKFGVTAGLNMVPGVGSVVNGAMGVKKSIDEKNNATNNEFHKGNVVVRTPVKSLNIPTGQKNTGNVKPQANSKKEVTLVDPKNSNPKKHK